MSVNTDRPLLDPNAGTVTPRQLWRRFLVFGIAIVLVVAGLGLRLFQLQVAEADRFQALAVQRRQGTAAVPVTRGLIYDRKGRQLVENVPVFVVRMVPGEIPYEQRDAVVERLATLLDMDRLRIYQIMDQVMGSSFEPLTIARGVSTQVARVIAEEHLGLPGISVEVEARRRYRYGKLVSHILGWTGRVTPEEHGRLASEGYLASDTIGKAGVELTFERQLRGTYGLDEVQRDAAGRVTSTLRTLREPVAGDSIELTIDLEIQREAQKALEWGMRAAKLQRGVFLVMNPQNGEILAMVSLPAYDNNEFARGVTTQRYRKLARDPNRPLINLAISEQLPPGSTYKLITGIGALQDRKILPSTRIRTAGHIMVAGTRMNDWHSYGWGHIDIYGGFAHSSDTFFYQVALRLGVDRLAYWAHEFGFGRKTGVDLPGETVGTVPTHAWKRSITNPPQPVYPGETAQAGIGQGYDMVTPLQLINAYSALANGGTLYRPQLVRRIRDTNGEVIRTIKPEVIRKLPIDASLLKVMRVASRHVLTSRHTLNFVDMPVVVAGKSGTAEYGVRDSKGRLPFHSWFVGFVPREARKKAGDPNGYKAVQRTDSELVFLAFAHDSRTRGNAAIEISKYFIQLHYGVKKDYRNPELMIKGNFYGQ
ncbi:MAG: penicillin-binding protein 2 [Chloroflexi bacterium]|nr:penicillin-binding protein 2 [Chloroflexota bacterium]